MVPELHADRSSTYKSIFLEHAANLVLDVPSDANEARAGNKDTSDLLALFTLDLYLAIPTHPDEFGETFRIILIALVNANRQSSMRVTSINADHRKIDPSELVSDDR